MGNESCCANNNDNQESKVVTMDEMIAKRQLARTPIPVLTERTEMDFKSTDRGDRNSSMAEGLVEKSGVKLEDGSVYKGQWRGSVKEGQGILTYPDGSVYTGTLFLYRRIQE